MNTLANLTNSSANNEMTSLINKLKQEINHLVLQLMYERNLRYKYEEQANSLHFIRIERDQLNVEKSYLEKNLKKLVEQYKDEVENCVAPESRSHCSYPSTPTDPTNNSSVTTLTLAYSDSSSKHESSSSTITGSSVVVLSA